MNNQGALDAQYRITSSYGSIWINSDGKAVAYELDFAAPPHCRATHFDLKEYLEWDRNHRLYWGKSPDEEYESPTDIDIIHIKSNVTEDVEHDRRETLANCWVELTDDQRQVIASSPEYQREYDIR